MAIFGSNRDISFLRKINREYLGNIVNQQCIFYKYDIKHTHTNIYGEPEKGERHFKPPVIFNCLIERGDQQYSSDDLGVDYKRNLKFYILRDDLVDNNLFPEVGDIIMYHESFFEVYNVIENQLFTGKDPQYPNEPNPINSGLSNFGYNVSIICETHYVSQDKVGILKSRLNG